MRFLIYNCIFLALTTTQVFCECGKTLVRPHTLIANGSPAELGAFPWHVGVYYMNWTSGELDHICGGSLIAPDLVISAAHCFYIEAEHRIGNAFEYAVAAGKIRRFYHEPEDYAQTSPVKSIHVPDGYTSSWRRSTTDIAIVRLQTPFNMTDYVSPVCIDWNSEYTGAHLRHGNFGKVMGWGMNASRVPSEALQQIDLPHIPLNICRQGAPKDFLHDLQMDKICAGYLNGSSVCKGDSGGGHSFHSDGRWYLRGVVSTSAYPGNGTCNNNYYTAFTNVGHYLKWIEEFFYDAEKPCPTMGSSTTGSCSLPEQPEGGRFEQYSSGKSSVHAAGSEVSINSVLIYRCNEGYTLLGNDYSICKDDGWTPPPTCVKPKPCPALRLANGDILCEYNGKIVPCESAMAPGTRATLKCKNYYKLSPALTEITCLEGGVWASLEFQCVPECGKAESMETPLIVNGSQVMHNSFPWWVGIYNKNLKSFVNAGTLIKPDLIVASDWISIGNNADALIVIAGKYYNSYEKLEPYAQTSFVKKIHGQHNFTGVLGDYAYQIALLRLETPFVMSKLVRPVCLDWRSEIAGGFPEVVKMPQWTFDRRTGSSDATYFEFEARFVNRASPSVFVDSSNRKYWRPEKFCYKLNAIANLDNKCCHYGAGIYAEKNNTWYLAGFPGLVQSDIVIWTNIDDFLPSFILEAERD